MTTTFEYFFEDQAHQSPRSPQKGRGERGDLSHPGSGGVCAKREEEGRGNPVEVWGAGVSLD